MSKGAQSVRACQLKEQPLGTIINAETGQPFSYKDACVRTDPHVGYNKAAMQATHTAVKELLRTVLRIRARRHFGPACRSKPNSVSRRHAASGVWRSLVARKFWVLQVGGSNPPPHQLNCPARTHG